MQIPLKAAVYRVKENPLRFRFVKLVRDIVYDPIELPLLATIESVVFPLPGVGTYFVSVIGSKDWGCQSWKVTVPAPSTPEWEESNI